MVQLQPSCVEDVGNYKSGCGYCGSEGDTSGSHGMWAHQLSVDAYQELLDRGWRRSGCWLYKPDLCSTCCPPYTIRIDVHRFIPSKGQRQVRNRFKSFLAGKDLPKRRPAGGSPMGSSPFGGSPVGGSPMACSPLAEMPSGMSPDRGSFSMTKAKGGRGKALKGQAVPDPGAESLARAVEEAIDEIVRRGRLPDVEYPVTRVAVPTAKQLKALPITTRYTSPTALAVFAASHCSHPVIVAASDLAEELAASLSDRLRSEGWQVEASRGYLNFLRAEKPAETTPPPINASSPFYSATAQECGLWPMEEEVVKAALPPAQDDDVVNTWWAGHVGHIRTGVGVQGNLVDGSSPRSSTGRARSGTLPFLQCLQLPALQFMAPEGDAELQGGSPMAVSSQMVHALSSGAISEGPAEGAPASHGVASKSYGGGRNPSVNSLDTLHAQQQGGQDTTKPPAGAPSPAQLSATLELLTAQQLGAAPRQDQAQASRGSIERGDENSRGSPSLGLPPLAPQTTSSAAYGGVQSAPSIPLDSRPQSHSLESEPLPPLSIATVPLQRAVMSQPLQRGQVSVKQGLARSDWGDREVAATFTEVPSPVSSSPQILPPLSTSPQHDRKRSKIRVDAMHSKAATGCAGGPEKLPHNFEVRMVPTSPELIEVEFPLYQRYQVSQHNDEPEEVTKKQFKRFLVDSPLVHVSPADRPLGACPSSGFGTFHQQYWLDGQLIAVGVVDVLPRALSSKYFFWDASHAGLSPGRLSALLEMDWVRAASASCPSLKYYMMGFYIASCPKMRYKAEYRPSELLCPRDLCWVRADRALDAIDAAGGYTPLSDLPGALEGCGLEQGILGNGQPDPARIVVDETALMAVRLLVGGTDSGQLLRLGSLLQAAAHSRRDITKVEDRVRQWYMLVGPTAARELIFMADSVLRAL